MTVLGGKEAARRAIAETAPGIKPLVARERASGEAETIIEALAGLNDTYRNMLLSAAGRDADPATTRAIKQAAATIALWWDDMPKAIRSEIDFKVDAWRKEHRARHAPEKHPAIDREAATRRVRMLLPHLRSRRSGVRSVAVALRLPA